MTNLPTNGAPNTPEPGTLTLMPLPAAPPPIAPSPLAQPSGRPMGSAWLIGWLVALVGWSCLLSFSYRQGGAEFEPTDCWVAQTAREMLEAGEWLVPRFSGETRLQKSPGAYWAVMLVSKLRGRPVDEIALRTPNAVASVLLVLTVFWLTRRIAGDRPAVFAGFATASSLLTLYWSHRGASDMGVAALCAISLSCWWVATSREPPGWKRTTLWLIAYFAAGVGMLYKLPMPLVCVGLPAFAYVVLRNRWRVLAGGWHLVGLALFLLPWLPWVAAVYFTEPTALAKWRIEFWDRFTGDLPNVEGQTAWPFYFMYLVPPLVFSVPYVLSLPGAFARTFRRQPNVDRDGQWFLLIWFFSLFVFFTAAAGKETRYFLPALPPLYVMLGCELAAFFDPQRAVSARALRAGAIAVWVLVPLGLAAGVYGLYVWCRHDRVFPWGQVWPPYVVMAAIFTIGTALAAWLYRRRLAHGSFAALVGTMWLAWFWTWPQLMPMLASEAPFTSFAARLQEKIPPDLRPKLRFVGSQEARLIWYGDVRMPRVIDQLELLRMQGGRRSLQKEIELIAREMVRLLSGDEPVLLVAGRSDYVRFLSEAPATLAKENNPFPRTYLWLQTDIGAKKTQYVVFGNQPPPWPETPLNPPSDKLRQAPATTRPATSGPS